MGDWVRYKLDQPDRPYPRRRGAGHQRARSGTSSARWPANISPGKGASQRHRTIFTVGDYKQAIFGFQGTDPESFDVARAWFAREARAIERDFLDLSMDKSFRSPPPILAVVDRVIADLGHDAFGLPRPPNPHESHHADRPGSVTLWLPVHRGERIATRKRARRAGSATRRGATPRALARQVADWLDKPFFARKPGPGAPARGHPHPGAAAGRARRLAGRAAPCRGRAGGGRRPAAPVGAAGGAGPARRRPLRRPAARRSQSRRPARLALVRLEPGASCSTPRTAARGRSGRISAPAAAGEAGCTRSSPWPIMRRRTSSSRRSCRGRSTGGASCSSGSAPRRATRSRNCSPPRSSSRAMPRPRCRPFSTGSRAATSRSSATLRRRSTRCG